MLTAIIITEKILRDSLVSAVSGIKQTHSEENIIFYQKNNYIFAFCDTLAVSEVYATVISEIQPEKIIFAHTGRSIDMEHEIGDIVLPNIFFHFNENILQTEISSENRDSLIGRADFLEIFEEQKDYFVEDFGLSIGAICVDLTPIDADNEKIMTVYGGDIYTDKNFSEIIEILKNAEIPTLLMMGIIDGKIWQYGEKNPLAQVSNNMMTTIRLINEEENL